MNIASFGHKFFIFGGLVLIAIAGVQLLARPRAKSGAGRPRPFDATTLRVALFATVGLLAILVGAGVIPLGPGR
jgi:hypothetical protein